MQINRLARVVAAAAIGASFCFAASPALAAADDPPGANGTVKIDALEFDTKIHNEPHVTCEFRVKLFDFDANEYGNIVFSAQAPSGKFQEVLRLDNQLLSNDAATGGNPDPDEIYPFTTDDLNLAGLTAQPQQGYHIKLTIERLSAPGAGKHKVFWLQPCGGGGSTPPSSPPSTPPSSPSTPTSSAPGGGGGGPSLPITGVAASSIAVVGAGLIGTGAVLLLRRRRKFVA